MYHILKHHRDKDGEFSKFVLVTEELKAALLKETTKNDIIDQLFVTGISCLSDRNSCLWPVGSYGAEYIKSIKIERTGSAIICDIGSMAE